MMLPLLGMLLLLSSSTVAIPHDRRSPDHVIREATPQDAPAPLFQYVPIKTGYAAFGDSYAAGIGAGHTGGGGCRRGSNGYPEQLAREGDRNLDFQNHACSGAVADEVLQGGKKSQIDDWSNPSKTDRATLSIGGNDIGFYNVLTACVLRVGMQRAGNCESQVQEAREKMIDGDIRRNVEEILRQILAKSGRTEDFKIIMTGYPIFFNDQTASCDYTTFYYWQPGHHGFHHGGNWAYLVKSRRALLNKLVIDFNNHLKVTVDNFNKGLSKQMVWFVDPNPAFDGHRFCEKGVTEPDSNRDDTWLFNAGWKDTAFSTLSNPNWMEPNVTEIPNEATCDESHDWFDQMLCEMNAAGMLKQTSSGIELTNLEGASDVEDADFVQMYEISSWKPTSSVKAFHPKSLGHKAYADLIKKVW